MGPCRWRSWISGVGPCLALRATERATSLAHRPTRQVEPVWRPSRVGGAEMAVLARATSGNGPGDRKGPWNPETVRCSRYIGLLAKYKRLMRDMGPVGGVQTQEGGCERRRRHRSRPCPAGRRWLARRRQWFRLEGKNLGVWQGRRWTRRDGGGRGCRTGRQEAAVASSCRRWIGCFGRRRRGSRTQNVVR